MPKARFTALVAALTLGTLAPRLAAQDTSSAAPARPDTSAYTGAGGVDTSARPGRIGAIDTAAATTDTTRVGQETPLRRRQAAPRLRDSSAAPSAGAAGADSAGGMGATDTSGMCGRHPDSTKVGDTTGAKAAPCPRESGTPQPRDSAR
jgi:hypothetical protein